MVANLRPQYFSSGLVADVQVDVVDALSVGRSIRTLIRSKKLPPGTAEIYQRVADQLVSGARLAIAVAAKSVINVPEPK